MPQQEGIFLDSYLTDIETRASTQVKETLNSSSHVYESIKKD